MPVTRPLKFLFHTVDFFSIPPKKLRVESNRVTNRTYFIHRRRIVAVATYS